MIDTLSTDFPTAVFEEIQIYFGTLPLIVGKQSNWRMRAKLAVRGTPSSPKIGLFKPGTHEVEDLINCSDHHPSINDALNVLRNFPLSPYNETTQEGELRYVQLTASRQSGKVQLVLVANGKNTCQELAEKLWQAFDWHSIWINIQEGSTNTIFGPTWQHCFGPKYLEESLLKHPIYLHPGCFMQAHLDLFEQILLEMRAQILPNKRVTELFAGIGIMSQILADKCESSTLIEINPFAEECFHKSNPPSHLKFITGKVEDHIDLFEEVLLVDPTRKGLPRKIHESIDSQKQILYLSCNFATLKRDIEILKEKGWEVCKATAYHLFPNTDHVEILVDLRRQC